MSGSTARLAGAAPLAREFDAAFARPLAPAGEDRVGLVAVRVGSVACAFLASEVRGVFRARRTAPVPGGARHLLGLAGVQGQVVAVYAVEGLLGHPESGEPPLWFALAATDERVAWAFDTLEGYLEVPASRLKVRGPGSGVAPVREVLELPGGPRTVLDVRGLLAGVSGKG